jgi:hypothetical protein
MEQVAIDVQGISIRLSKAELGHTASAMREIIDGPHIPDWEFKIRLGESRADALRLLTELEDVIDVMPSDT